MGPHRSRLVKIPPLMRSEVAAKEKEREIKISSIGRHQVSLAKLSVLWFFSPIGLLHMGEILHMYPKNVMIPGKTYSLPYWILQLSYNWKKPLERCEQNCQFPSTPSLHQSLTSTRGCWRVTTAEKNSMTVPQRHFQHFVRANLWESGINARSHLLWLELESMWQNPSQGRATNLVLSKLINRKCTG